MHDFNAEVFIDVYHASFDEDNSVSVEVALTCTRRSSPGFINGPPEKCYAPESAEFVIDHFTLGIVKFTWEEMEEFFGKALTLLIADDADEQACMSGDF